MPRVCIDKTSVVPYIDKISITTFMIVLCSVTGFGLYKYIASRKPQPLPKKDLLCANKAMSDCAEAAVISAEYIEKESSDGQKLQECANSSPNIQHKSAVSDDVRARSFVAGSVLDRSSVEPQRSMSLHRIYTCACDRTSKLKKTSSLCDFSRVT